MTDVTRLEEIIRAQGKQLAHLWNIVTILASTRQDFLKVNHMLKAVGIQLPRFLEPRENEVDKLCQRIDVVENKIEEIACELDDLFEDGYDDLKEFPGQLIDIENELTEIRWKLKELYHGKSN